MALLQAAEAGRGLICDGMATLSQHTLAAVGVLSRKVVLHRNVFDAYDAHTTVEVWLDGHWAVTDPTFNICLQDAKGRCLSAQDEKGALFAGRERDVCVVPQAEVRYPIRPDNYYLNVLLCFNNVFAYDRGQAIGALARITSLRYWLGPKLLYEKLAVESTAHLAMWQQLY